MGHLICFWSFEVELYVVSEVIRLLSASLAEAGEDQRTSSIAQSSGYQALGSVTLSMTRVGSLTRTALNFSAMESSRMSI